MLNTLNDAQRYHDLAEEWRRLAAFSFSTQIAKSLFPDGRGLQ